VIFILILKNNSYVSFFKKKHRLSIVIFTIIIGKKHKHVCLDNSFLSKTII